MRPLPIRSAILAATVTLSGAASAQEPAADPYAECGRLLASPPLNQMKARTEDGTYGKFSNDVLEDALTGIMCRPEQIKTYMFSAGWKLETENDRQAENERYPVHVMIFAKPFTGFRAWLPGEKNSGQANFYLVEEKVQRIIMGPTK